MAKSLEPEPNEYEGEMLAANLDGCLFDIEHYLELIEDQIDEARTYLEKLSK